MPSYTRGFTRDDIVFAKTKSAIWHGFKPKNISSIPGVTEADVTALGWKPIGQVPAAGYPVIGANSPKPQRVIKILNKRANANQQRSLSTFVSEDSIVTAQGAGWELTGFARGSRGGATLRGENVGAEIGPGGGIYVFWMNLTDAVAYAALLGLKRPADFGADERRFAFSGASRPRPAKMGKIINEATGGTFSSFVSYDNEDNALEAGFKYIRPAVLGPRPDVAAAEGD